MQTYYQREVSRQMTEYLYKKRYNLPKQLQRAYALVEELEAVARMFGMEEHIGVKSPEVLTDQQLLDRHALRSKGFKPNLTCNNPKETQTNE